MVYRTDLFNVDGLIYPCRMYTEQIHLMAECIQNRSFNVDGLIYPLVQNVYRTDLFNVDGLSTYVSDLFNVDCLIYAECIQNRSF